MKWEFYYALWPRMTREGYRHGHLMRTRVKGKWIYRPPTDEEMDDWRSFDAW